MQALSAPGGIPLWVSDVLPGSTHDLTAARELVLPEARPYLKDLPFLADSGYEGAGAGVHVPVRKPADSVSWQHYPSAQQRFLFSDRAASFPWAQH